MSALFPPRKLVRRGDSDLPWRDLDTLCDALWSGRGEQGCRQADFSLEGLPSPALMPGIGDATVILADAVRRGESILVVGDYDADGATSTALVLRCLAEMGCERAGYVLPNRFEFGYGLSAEIVDTIIHSPPDVLVTVDNGISSLAGVEKAVAAGIRVVITDHHLPGETLPAAHAIVNPNLPGSEFPSGNLAGVGVAFYVMLGLRQALRDRDWFTERGIAEPNLARHLDLVALGTVADVVRLDGVNRILVEQGLRRIRAGRSKPGIRALVEIGGRSCQEISARDLGFVVGPRLNAAGRLDDMTVGVQTLLGDSDEDVVESTGLLDRFNTERKKIEAEMRDQAITLIAGRLRDSGGALGDVVCLYDPGWHQGVVGLVASRIRQLTGLPCIVFADADEGILKGSARSVEGVHIKDLLAEIEQVSPGLMAGFGGHAMAAGLTLDRSRLEQFRAAFASALEGRMGDLRADTVISDGELSPALITTRVARRIQTMAPWGAGFPEPQFDGEFKVVENRRVGDRHLKMSLGFDGSDRTINAIAFGVLDGEPPPLDRVRLVYRLDVDRFRGRETPLLLIEYLEPC